MPLVKLIGAWALIVIALNVSADSQREALPTREPGAARRDLWAAATAIVVADAAMSLDNVVALAAIARGNFWLLAAGVVLRSRCSPTAALFSSAALRAAPWLVKLGAALLGWIAGDMAVTDPLIGGWIAVNAPALAAIAPALGAVFVFFAGPSARPPTPAPPAAARPAPRAVAAEARGARRRRRARGRSSSPPKRRRRNWPRPSRSRRSRSRPNPRRASSAAAWRCRPRTVSP